MPKLSELQARANLLPQALRGYIEMLAPMADDLGEELRSRFENLRGKARVDGHDRLPEAVAHLFIGLEMGVGFALQVGAIDEVRAKEILGEGWDIFMELAQDHGKLLSEERPTRIFLQTIQEALSNGRAWLANRTTGVPSIGGSGTEKIGWIDEDGIYLMPTTTFGLVTRLLQHRGGLSLSDRALREMLLKDGILLRKDSERLTSKIRCEGKPVSVLWLRRDALGDQSPESDGESGEPSQTSSNKAICNGCGQPGCPGCGSQIPNQEGEQP